MFKQSVLLNIQRQYVSVIIGVKMDTRVREQERSVNQMHGLLSEKLAGGSQVEKIREKKKQCSTTHVAVKGVQTE